MQTNLCSADFEMLFLRLRTCANHSKSFVTCRHCHWRMICDVKLSGKLICIAALQNVKNTMYIMPLNYSSFEWGTQQIACLRIAVIFILASIWFLTVKWSKQEVLAGGNISRGRMALRYWLYEVHWLIYCNENAVLWLKIRATKHNATDIS